MRSLISLCILAALATLASTLTLPSYVGSALQPRAGPSGYVISPEGGSVWTEDAGTLDTLYIAYHSANMTPCNDNCYTYALDIWIQDMNQQFVVTLANGWLGGPTLMSDATGYIIYGLFVHPDNVCGQYQLAFREYQMYNSEVISFIAAAPTITIDCGSGGQAVSRSLTARAGPSGSVVWPEGGESYAAADTLIYVEYDSAVSETYTTYAIDIWLQDMNQQYVFTLANHLEGSDSPPAQIIATFLIPPGLCGSYQMAFREYQWNGYEVINFISAAPTVTFEC